MNWVKLPKAELHRHLDGSIRFDTIIELAHMHNIDLGARNRIELMKKVVIKEPMTSLEQVLDSFWTSQKVLASYEAIKRVAFENVEDAYYDGIKLIELRFAPVFIQKNKTLGFDEIIEGVIDGVTEGMNKYPIQVGLIHIMPRSLDLKLNLKSTEDILRYRKTHHKNADRLVGIYKTHNATKSVTINPKSFVVPTTVIAGPSVTATAKTAPAAVASNSSKNAAVLV